MNTELEHLRIRIMAMKHFFTPLSAQFSELICELDRKTASDTFPGPDHTQLPQIPNAATQSVQVTQQTRRFRAWVEDKVLS